MSKNLKLSYVLTFVLCAISLAWTTLMSFFNGVGVNFVAMFAIVAALLVIILVDEKTRKRIMDLFIVSGVFLALESVMYFALELGTPTLELVQGMHIYQNIISVLAFLFLGYAIFRLVCEIKDKKIAFIEVMLGNQKMQKKERQAKELDNGSLDDKPKKAELETLDDDEEEQVVEIKTEDNSESSEE